MVIVEVPLSPCVAVTSVADRVKEPVVEDEVTVISDVAEEVANVVLPEYVAVTTCVPVVLKETL